MKRTNFLKIAFTLVLAFVITGAFAQFTGTDVPGDGADFVTNYETAGQETVGTTYLMEGTTIPLFALPDPYYHPSYDNSAPTDYTLHNDGFTWTWTEATTTLTITQAAAEDNYVTVGAAVGDAAGSPYTINVIEAAPAAWGGCSDLTKDEDITINVVAQPTATLASTVAVNACVGGAALPATVIATTAAGWQNYRLEWTLEIATLDATATKDQWFDDEDGNVPAGAAKNVPESTTQAAPATIAALGGTLDIFTVASYKVINSKPTVYTYTLANINDQASRYGDFIGLGGVDGAANTFTYYAIAAQQLVVTVNPSPDTGPIYHINSSWAN